MDEESKQKWLDAFVKRAGFNHGWENLELWARKMAEQAYLELVVEDESGWYKDTCGQR